VKYEPWDKGSEDRQQHAESNRPMAREHSHAGRIDAKGGELYRALPRGGLRGSECRSVAM